MEVRLLVMKEFLSNKIASVVEIIFYKRFANHGIPPTIITHSYDHRSFFPGLKISTSTLPPEKQIGCSVPTCKLSNISDIGLFIVSDLKKKSAFGVMEAQ